MVAPFRAVIYIKPTLSRNKADHAAEKNKRQKIEMNASLIGRRCKRLGSKEYTESRSGTLINILRQDGRWPYCVGYKTGRTTGYNTVVEGGEQHTLRSGDSLVHPRNVSKPGQVQVQAQCAAKWGTSTDTEYSVALSPSSYLLVVQRATTRDSTE